MQGISKKAVHFYENPESREGTALCLEPRRFSLTNIATAVTCKRCLHLMKLPIGDIREARNTRASERAFKLTVGK